LVDVEPARHQIDIADAQPDQFGPAQPGKGQDGDDVALIAAWRCQGSDFSGREVAVAFSRGIRPAETP
jgi:hypothetical protein